MPRKLLILAATLVGAHLASLDSRGVPCRHSHRKSSSGFGQRTGGLDVPGRVAPRARHGSSVLGTGGLRDGRLGIGEPRLDVLRTRFAYHSDAWVRSAVLLQLEWDFLCDGAFS